MSAHPLPEVVVRGLAWPESPRWHDGALWFSDVYHFRVVRWRPGETPAVIANAASRPSGLGFMPDGRLLMATALDKKLWWVSSGRLELAIDLSRLVSGVLNDMVVDVTGRVWVGDTGFDLLRGEAMRPGALLTWAPGEAARIAVPDVDFPNGLAICGDGKVLFLAETFGRRISAFDVHPGGLLARRRIHATLEERPDGLCLDAAGALWVALHWRQELQRIAPDGSVTQRFEFPHERAISCVLGGAGRRSLFAGVATVDETDKTVIKRVGSILRIPVEVPGAGIP